MSTYSLPIYYENGKGILSNALDKGTIRMRKHLSDIIDIPNVLYYHISPLYNEEGHDLSNISLTLQLETLVYTQEKSDIVKKEYDLALLQPRGDVYWMHRIKHLVWGDKYPSCIAIDKNRKDLYLVYITENGLELNYFTSIKDFLEEEENDMTDFLYFIDNDRPYTINLDSDAMFKYIDGYYGIYELQKNVVVSINLAPRTLELKVDPRNISPL